MQTAFLYTLPTEVLHVMITIAIRTLLVYLFMLLFMKMMGKRQVGELEISELVSALLLSELASMPIENADIPLISAIIPLLIIICTEIVLSFCATKFEPVKRFLCGKPSILIKRGEIDVGELAKARMSLEELMSEMRLSGIAQIGDIEYAILEQNGHVSFIQKRDKCPLTPSDLSVRVTEGGISHALIVDGYVKEASLQAAGVNKGQLEQIVLGYGTSIDKIFLLTINDNKETDVIYKEKK